MSLTIRAAVYLRRPHGRFEPPSGVILSSIAGDPNAVMLSSAHDPNRPSRAFLDLVGDFVRHEDVDSVLFESGPDLEPEPDRTREDLARFDFEGCRGVGLRAAHASWVRAWLAAGQATLFAVNTDSITFFLTASLCRVLGIAERESVSPAELFVPWFAPDQNDALGGSPVHSWVFHASGAAEDLPSQIQSALPSYEPEAIVWPLPVYLLSAISHPQKVREELGPERGAELLESARRLTDIPYPDLTPADRQILEWGLLRAVRFRHKTAPIALLFLAAERVLRMLVEDGGRQPADPASSFELETAAAVFRAVGATQGFGYSLREPEWEGDAGAEVTLFPDAVVPAP